MDNFYEPRIAILKDIFGAEELSISPNSIDVDGTVYPVIDGVIICLKEKDYPPWVRNQLRSDPIPGGSDRCTESNQIQHTFGEEWKEYNDFLPEHEIEFNQYFDIVELDSLKDKRICDLGCGIGRWSYFLQDHAKELIMVDFSEAIFVTRKNLSKNENAIFIMGDIENLPFRENFADFILCLGVLHHLPTPALKAVRALSKYSPELLIYLYYDLSNRPFYFHVMLYFVTILRSGLCKVRHRVFRLIVVEILLWSVYLPLIGLGHCFSLIKLGRLIPLFQFYGDMTLKRIRQDVYDRFFTSIEQRVSTREINQLKDTFRYVEISKGIPYWHFICKK